VLLLRVFSASRGFTPYSRDDYIQWKKEGRLVSAGVHAQVGSMWKAQGGGQGVWLVLGGA
jgi:hypothetical protein